MSMIEKDTGLIRRTKLPPTNKTTETRHSRKLFCLIAFPLLVAIVGIGWIINAIRTQPLSPTFDREETSQPAEHNTEKAHRSAPFAPRHFELPPFSCVSSEVSPRPGKAPAREEPPSLLTTLLEEHRATEKSLFSLREIRITGECPNAGVFEVDTGEGRCFIQLPPLHEQDLVMSFSGRSLYPLVGPGGTFLGYVEGGGYGGNPYIVSGMDERTLNLENLETDQFGEQADARDLITTGSSGQEEFAGSFVRETPGENARLLGPGGETIAIQDADTFILDLTTDPGACTGDPETERETAARITVGRDEIPTLVDMASAVARDIN